MSTCKQVRFLFEAFRKLRPGVPLRALHGKMNQYKRMGGERSSGGRRQARTRRRCCKTRKCLSATKPA